MKISDNKYKKQILNFFGLAKLSVTKQNKVISTFSDNVATVLTTKVLDRLTEQEKEKLSEMSRKGEIIEYLNSRINDLPFLAEIATKETIGEINK